MYQFESNDPVLLYILQFYIIIFYFFLGVATGTSVIYGREAPELQLRKMADLYFMFKMYKQAYTHYHTSKKDFYVSRIWQIWIFGNFFEQSPRVHTN